MGVYDFEKLHMVLCGKKNKGASAEDPKPLEGPKNNDSLFSFWRLFSLLVLAVIFLVKQSWLTL